MSTIDPIDPSTARGRTRELLQAVHERLGATPALFCVAAQSSATLEGLVALNVALGQGTLDARVRESIALAVAETNGCDYCLSAHSALAAGAGLDQTEIDAARSIEANDNKTAAALRFAKELVTRRGKAGGDALAALRRAGAGDDEILEVVANVILNLFTNYINLSAQTPIDFPVVRSRTK